jgi:3-hydroxyanthranilate 3,4-dioxygenase
MKIPSPFELKAWIDENRSMLRPPVGNKLLFDDSDFIVMAVGGPNSRKDYHHDPHAELFYQLEGDIVLKTIQDGRMVDVPIREGEMFLLPAEVPHSPQRPPDTVGVVVEQRRGPGEFDGFSWYCENCGNQLYIERIAVHDIVTQLPAIFARFFESLEHRTCRVCGTVLEPPGGNPSQASAP